MCKVIALDASGAGTVGVPTSRLAGLWGAGSYSTGTGAAAAAAGLFTPANEPLLHKYLRVSGGSALAEATAAIHVLP